MDDAQLVVAARVGDRNAYAAIYDRYADRIHDFCASMLRNRADAADALQETFVVAFDAIDDLAEPARLRSWLYAIAHRSVRDSIDRQGTPFFTADTDLVPTVGAPSEPLSRAELAEFIWEASGSLDLADRILLDLHQRQGLEGRDLAGASGMAGPQLDARLPRLEAQVERSLGALLVARTGRRSCPDLSAILSHLEDLPPDFRDRVTAHVDDCERCNSRRRIAPNPLTLLVATPLAPAPAYLRGVVLGKAELSALRREGDDGGGAVAAPVGWAFNRDGFPELGAGTTIGGGGVGESRRPAPPTGPIFASTRPTTALPPAAGGLAAGLSGASGGVSGGGGGTATTYLPRFEPLPDPRRRDDHDRRGMVIGALAGFIILIAGVVILVSSRGRGGSGPVAVTATTTSVTQPTTTTTPSTLPAVVASTVPSTTAVPKGHVIVGSKTLDLGVAATTGSVQIGNDGAAPADFTLTVSGTGLTVIPAVGTLNAGASQTLAVTLDRTLAPPGPFTGSIAITSPAGNAAISVTATIDPGPVINGELANPQLVSSSTCPGHSTSTTPTMSTITASVTSTEALKIVVLHWQGPAGGAGASPEQTTTMTMGATGYSGNLPAFNRVGTVDWWITAVDVAYVTTTSSHHPLTVACA
jgi:RNA polymerase sigma factor (sigma-70 family)